MQTLVLSAIKELMARHATHIRGSSKTLTRTAACSTGCGGKNSFPKKVRSSEASRFTFRRLARCGRGLTDQSMQSTRQL